MSKSRSTSMVLSVVLVALLLVVSPVVTMACSRGSDFSFDELFAADVIIRATAVRYVVPPDPNTRTTGVRDSAVEFKVVEVLRGEDVPATIILNGYLSDKDDYNDVEVPYQFVRPGGRSGSCFANTYKEGAMFLLFLKKTKDGYTPDISALGPTNEQLHGADDAWLQWVRKYLKAQEKKEEKVAFFSDVAKSAMIWVRRYLVAAS